MSVMDAVELRQVLTQRMAVIERMLTLENGALYGDAMEDFQRRFFESGETLPDGRPKHRLRYREDIRGGSKTTDGVADAIADLISGPRGHRSVFVAADLEQGQIGADTAAGFVDRSPLVAQLIKVDRYVVRNKITGSELRVISADQRTSYGKRLRRVYFDEFSLQVDDRLWVSMWSTIGKSPYAQAVVLSMAGFDTQSIGYKVRELARTTPEYHFQTRQDAPMPSWLTPEMLEEQRRTLPPGDFDRLFRAVWTEMTSQGIDIGWWDRAAIGRQVPADRGLDVVVGVDVGWKSDLCALVATTFDQASKRVRVVNHAVFTPQPDQPVDLESAVERTLRDWSRRFRIVGVYIDPWQAASSLQRLQAIGVPITEYPQTPSNISAATDALYQLLRNEALVAYDAPEIRSAIAAAALVSTPRGWRLEKAKSSGKIDAAVALALSCRASLDLLTDTGFDIVGPIIQVATSTLDGLKHVVESARDRLSAHEEGTPTAVAPGEPDAIVEHPGIFDPRTGRPASNHPASKSAVCGVCVAEERDAMVRAGRAYVSIATAGLVLQRVGRLGSRFLTGVEDPAQRAELLTEPGDVHCGYCGQRLRDGHRGDCVENNLLPLGQSGCAYGCRAKVGHESDCDYWSYLANTGYGGAW